jgi:hypothetical protein
MQEPFEPAPESLELRAFLYAAGGLDPSEVHAFEARLASEQDAREALARAVAAAGSPDGGPPRPNLAYRARVRRRLLGSAGLWHALRRPRKYHGHAAAGLAAALLFVIGLEVLPGPEAEPAPVASPSVDARSVPPAPARAGLRPGPGTSRRALMGHGGAGCVSHRSKK